MQNSNAANFRLFFLNNEEIRYEVIYKNLLRDLRRYFKQEYQDFIGY